MPYYRLKPKVILSNGCPIWPNDEYEEVELDCHKHNLIPCPDYGTEKCCGCEYYPSWRVKENANTP